MCKCLTSCPVIIQVVFAIAKATSGVASEYRPMKGNVILNFSSLKGLAKEPFLSLTTEHKPALRVLTLYVN
jgi:hypothetical protein